VTGVVLVVVWFLFVARRLRFETAFWSAVGLSLLLAWHSFKYDYALAFPFFYLLWREHRVRLAALCLCGGLWLHAFLWERQTWVAAPLVVTLTVLVRRSTRMPVVRRHMPPRPEVLRVPETSN